jgi:hypothetical protein
LMFHAVLSVFRSRCLSASSLCPGFRLLRLTPLASPAQSAPSPTAPIQSFFMKWRQFAPSRPPCQSGMRHQECGKISLQPGFFLHALQTSDTAQGRGSCPAGVASRKRLGRRASRFRIGSRPELGRSSSFPLPDCEMTWLALLHPPSGRQTALRAKLFSFLYICKICTHPP